ncbi:MAG: insulinase family protein [Lachnospiraceae bacterium]|nr:insulinase family protein [Lachnospiraceae bacterium]
MASCIKNISEFNCPETYELVKSEYINEVKSLGIILKHKKSGARIMLLSNKDDNKVFSIGFRTPPKDSTGTQHIIEHTVLCGSENFPSKDPFVELVKGSLNTYLNATTYPDKTLYPIASTNAKDFNNLMHVYLDAVFNPNIYKYEEIFKQEGWHYELEEPDGELIYNGVVYNEMKGAYSSDDNMLETYLIRALFPDTTYANDSGGDPAIIPDLTREAYLEYHKNYYHPVNSYIYIYGDMDMEERLVWLDENYLSKYDRIELDSEIGSQKRFDGIHKVKEIYAVADDDDRENLSQYAYAVMTDATLDRKTCAALDVLSYILIDMPGAYLKERLVEKGLGTDISADVCELVKQSYFAIYIKNVVEDKSDEILDTIKEVLEELVEKGIDKKILEATINSNEFKDREGDFGTSPKGLIFYLRCLHTWLYNDDECFSPLYFEENYKYLREGIENGLYEDLIKKYFLDNPHQVIVEMDGKKGLTAENDRKTAEKLKAYKDSLSEEEILKLVEDTKALKAYQAEPSPKEDLEKIPLLEISDIDRNARPINYVETEIDGMKTIYSNEETNGIVYLNLLFNLEAISDRPSELSVLASLLGYLDTTKHSYLDFDTMVNMYIGAMAALTTNYRINNKNGEYKPYFEVSAKILSQNLDKAMEIIHEMIYETSFEDESRISDVIKEFRSKLKNSMMFAGHQTAALHAQAAFSKSGFANDASVGIGYYNYLVDLDDNFDAGKEGFLSDLKLLPDIIFNKENVLIGVTADEDGFDKLKKAIGKLELKENAAPVDTLTTENTIVFEKKTMREAFTTPAPINYVAVAGEGAGEGNIEKSGILNVVRHLLSYDFLWNNVRVLGGAYGVGCRYDREGNGFFSSYRDPNISRTIEVYKMAGEYLRTYDADPRELQKTIIGTISGMDTPLTPFMKGMRSLGAYLTETSFELIQKEREQVLDCSLEDIHEIADVVDNIFKEPNVCVIGSEEEINNEKELFIDISALK